MEFHHPLRGDAANCTTTDCAGAPQRIRRIQEAIFRRTIDAVASFVERDNVNIDFSTITIRQNEVERPFNFTFRAVITPGYEELLEPCQVPVFKHNIQIFMGARLPMEECIDAPSTIDPNVNTLPTQGRVDVEHIRRCHGFYSARGFVDDAF